MKIIRPTTVTDSILTSSSVSETDAAAYAGATTYAADELVIYNHRIYRSLASANTNHTPGDTASVAWWVDTGPTNQRAMFDGVVGTKTTAAGSLTVVLAPGIVDGVALLNVDASTVNVSMVVDGVTVYSKTTSMLDAREVTDGYSYCFSPIRQRTKLVLLDLPAYLYGVVTITLSAPSGNVSCGMCIIGRQCKLGATEYGAAPGIDDYSKVDFDGFGGATLNVRNYAIPLDVTVWVDNVRLDFLCVQLAELRATPVVWIGADNLFDCMISYGIYRGFRPVIRYLNHSILSLQIKGMI